MSHPNQTRPTLTTVFLSISTLLVLGGGSVFAQVIEIERNLSQWQALTTGWSSYAFEQHFVPPVSPPLGCVSGDGFQTMPLGTGSVSLFLINDVGTSCPIIDGTSGSAVADAALQQGYRLVMTFEPPIKAFYAYYGSLASGHTITVRTVNEGGLLDVTTEGPPSTHPVLGTGYGFASSIPVQTLEITSSEPGTSLLGYFDGLLTGEQSLGQCGGDPCDFAVAYETATPKVFGTPVSGTGDLGSWPEAGEAEGIGAGDAICQHWATQAGLANSNNFIAVLSDSKFDLACRVRGLNGTLADNCNISDELPSAGPWWHVTGKPWGGPLGDSGLDGMMIRRPPMIDVFAEVYTTSHYTGTIFDGTAAAFTCGDWTTGDDSQAGFRGDSTETFYWLGRGPRDCDLNLPLMCLEIGTAPPLPPEPDTGRFVFITAAAGTGDIQSWPEVVGPVDGPIEAADSICQSEAEAAGMEAPTSFRAWLSTSSLNAIDRLTNDGAWRCTDNVRLADTRAALTSSPLETSIRLRADGTEAIGLVWTGTSNAGQSTTSTCAGWTSSESGDQGTSGLLTAAMRWTNDRTNPCNQQQHLYCFSDAQDPEFIFADGFESGGTSTW